MPGHGGTNYEVLEVLKMVVSLLDKMTGDGGAGSDPNESRSQAGKLFESLNINIESLTQRSQIERGVEIFMEGDIFSNIGAGATVVNRSSLNNSLNSIKISHGDEVTEALARLSEIVEQSGNREAAENFNALTDELSQQQPRKSLVKSFWNGIRDALPAVKDILEIGAKLAPLLP